MHASDQDPSAALLDLVGLISDPRRDGRLMAEAGLDIDPAFLPVLVRLGAWGPTGVVELAAHIGRDHSTISRQLARLQAAGLVARTPSTADRRVRAAQVTAKGLEAVAALSTARRRLLDAALAGWTARDRTSLTQLLARFVEALKSAPAASG